MVGQLLAKMAIHTDLMNGIANAVANASGMIADRQPI
jgi:hypothetical protein